MAAKRKKTFRAVATRVKLVREMVRVAKAADKTLGDKLAAVATAGPSSLSEAVDVAVKSLNGRLIEGRVAGAKVLGHAAQYACGYCGGLLPEILDALPVVVGAASSSNAEVRIAAFEALAGFAPGAGWDVVVAVTAREMRTAPVSETKAAIGALRACGVDAASAAVGWLSQQLGHSDVEVQQDVCATLAWLAEDAVRAVPYLLATALRDVGGHGPGVAAMRALVEIDSEGTEIPKHLKTDEQRTVFLDSLRRAGPTARGLRRTFQSKWKLAGSVGKASSPKPKKRPCYDRDHEFLQLVEDAERQGIKNKWAYARDEYNNRRACNVLHGKSGTDIVRKGTERARAERDAAEEN